jgi:hypothetical protein
MQSDEMFILKIFENNPHIAQFGGYTAFIKTVLRNLATQLKRAHRVVLGTLESVANFIYIKKTHKLRDA